MTEPVQKTIIINKLKTQLTLYSFYITFVFLSTTSTITFIEAISTKHPHIRNLFNLETCISIIAGFFYYIFITKVEEYKKLNIPIDWGEFTILRYTDWSITTPFMLMSLLLFLSYNVNIPVTLPVIVFIWLMNYLMLFFGFLGEIGTISRTTACIGGFFAYFSIAFIVYITFIEPKYNLGNIIVYILHFLVWSLYGVVYMFTEENKNILTNFLDLISKCFIGIGMWFYFTEAITLPITEKN